LHSFAPAIVITTYETEPDLLGFDSAPAPAAATPASEEFGAFQATSAPAAPAGPADDFAEFGSLRSAPVPAASNDPFAAPPAAPQAAQPPQQFNAFGNSNNNAMGGMMAGGINNGMTAPISNNSAGSMPGITNAFGNMNMAGGMQPQQPTMPADNDDEFGDFSAAQPSLAAPAITMNTSDPMSKLINLDGLSKNPSKMKPNTNQQQMGNPMGNPMGQQMQMGQQNVTGVPQPGRYCHSL
jgi:hypothetical protein